MLSGMPMLTGSIRLDQLTFACRICGY